MGLSYQLYSSRNFGPFPRVLKMLSDIGYRQVEGYAALFADLSALEDALAETGMKMTTAHVGLADMEADADAMVAKCKKLGLAAVYGPWLPPEERATDVAGWTAFAKRLKTALAPFDAAGFQTGWHNHDFELIDLGGGTTAMDILAREGLGFELDCGWVARAGHDPAVWLAKLGSAVTACHVKDIAPAGTTEEDGWADLGHGVVDYAPIVAAARALGISRFVAEHDNPADDARFAARSFATFQTL